ncbi:kinase/pyrophosphorylase [Planctomycetes bacterium K23_9]|uniref:Pyruvate, phosphate dikinase regulatory protein n=1 Tax=Stieleria marina TaxID=1930275 RepID=A0A517NR13_9BACT|nr:Putative pyruvate, phosphate dikinase regulatory protein [Planctomycetes bacterium K23_9]
MAKGNAVRSKTATKKAAAKTMTKASKPPTKKKTTAKKKAARKATTLTRKKPATKRSNKARSRKATSAKQFHVITDGTGGLPRHFLKAILTQFPDLHSQPMYHVFCDTPEKILKLFKKTIPKNAFVVHSLACEQTKATLQEQADARGIDSYDMTGGAVAFVSQQVQQQPIEDLDSVHTQNAAYFDRIDAWEFTMQHDDSRRLDSINKADIVLLGISRVSKTPTAAFLGWLGHRVANVSFAPEQGVPAEIKACRSRVVALTMAPKNLSEIRNRRLRVNGFADKILKKPDANFRYAAVRDTIREVMAAEQIYKRLRVPIVDVTDATVEETAARVLQRLELE